MKTQHTKTGIVLLLHLFFGLSGFGQLVVTPSIIDEVCQGNDGYVSFTTTGGSSSTYHYYLSHLYPSYYVGGQSAPTFTSLYAGYYSVSVYNGTDSTTLIFEIPSKIKLTKTVTNAVCPSTLGTAVVTATGGTGSLSYNWSDGTHISSITSTMGGAYNVTVTDAIHCYAVQSDTIGYSSPVVLNITNMGSVCTPTLTANVTGSTGIVSYLWSTGATTAAITAAANSYYSVTATDANGCSAAQSTYIANTYIQVDSTTSTVISPSCLTNGSITVATSNGTAPFQYVWSNGATGVTASGLIYGAYNLTVTDANGCTGTGYFNLSNYQAVTASICGATNPACGGADGILTVCANGGNNVYTYQWTGSTSTTSSASGLAAGSYTVTVTDSNGCSATASRTLQGVTNLHVTIQTTPTACDSSLHTGTATALVTGGMAPYSYTWTLNRWSNPTIIGTTQTVTNLAVYSDLYVHVTDASGCTSPFDSISAYIQFDSACFDHITGYVYNDANANCSRDTGETGTFRVGVYAVNTSGGTPYYASPDSTGYYDIQVLPGTYNVSFSVGTEACVTNSCTNSHTANFSAIGQTSTGNDFGLNSGSPAYNLGLFLGYNVALPGQTHTYWLIYDNEGQTAASNCVLTFVHDANLVLTNTVPAYSAYNSSTHTLTWNLGTINASNNSWPHVLVNFQIPSTVALGTPLTSLTQIGPTANDCNTSNNQIADSHLVCASYDPNDKAVSPAGNLSESDTVLNYTIRFQNTGNAPATLVIIKDTLSSNVDPATVVHGASSSPYKFNLSGNGILTFTFQPIYLTDSTTNLDSSMGFVNYSVHTKKNLLPGEQIRNTAYIYFDANPAIVTNTTVSTRSNATGITDIENNAMTALVIPNPVHDMALIEFTGATGNVQLRITDALGNMIVSGNSDGNRYTLNAEKLSAGIYFYTAEDTNHNRASGKISIVK